METPRCVTIAGWRPPLALSFAAFAVFVCLLATALCIVDLMHARSVAVSVARREAENLTQSLAQQASETFDAADGALRTIAARAAAGVSRPADGARLHDLMTALIATTPRLHDLTITDARGRRLASTLPATDPRLASVAGQQYFQYHRSRPDVGVAISWRARSRTSPGWDLYATRRLDRPDGSFAGVAIATIALDYFERSFARVDVGRAGTIALVADDGSLVVRRPHVAGAANAQERGMFGDEYKTFMAASYIGASPSDGVRRLLAFEQLGRYPLVLQVGLAESEYLAAWRADAIANYIALAFGTALIGALAMGLGAQITRRKRAEDALALLPVDVLTGLANRNRFDTELAREWRGAARANAPLALLLIEVGNLKTYNDRFGHDEGDDLLISIAQLVARSVPASALAARYSGLELAVLLPATDEADALATAERLRVAIRDLVAQRSGSRGVSVIGNVGGASHTPQSADDSSMLVGAALVALHRSRNTADGDLPAPLHPDALTGLANRRQFDAELERSWQRAAQGRTPLGLVLIEIENLKTYNDRFGREAGDDLLIAIARAIAATVDPATQLAARYNGLELAVLLPSGDGAGALIVADRVRLAIGDVIRLKAGVRGSMVTWSCGSASVVPETADEPSMLVGAALIALHGEKRDAEHAALGIKPILR